MNERIVKWGMYGGLAGAAYVLLDSLFLEKYFFEINHFDIGRKNGSSKLRLVLLTDLHFQEKVWPFYKRLARKVNELNPDLLMFSGDTVDQWGTLPPVQEFLDLIDHHMLKVAIPGNHDHVADIDLNALGDIFESHNCRFLVNETKVFNIKGCELAVTGLDDFIKGNANTREAVEGVTKHQNHILLVHSPLQHERAMKRIKEINETRRPEEQIDIKYIFAGHNHGGQVRLFDYAPVLPKKSGGYLNGWYNNSSPYLYVSKGFGTSGIPFRFMARSEVTVFDYYF